MVDLESWTRLGSRHGCSYEDGVDYIVARYERICYVIVDNVTLRDSHAKAKDDCTTGSDRVRPAWEGILLGR